MNKKRTWSQVTKGIEKRLNKEQGPRPRFYGLPRDEVRPSNGLFGGRFEFDGGPQVHIEVKSTQAIIGSAGVDGWYKIYMLDSGGNVIPQWETPGSVRRFASAIPLNIPGISNGTAEIDLNAPFDSAYGYHWLLNLTPRITTNKQSYLFYKVFRQRL